MKWGFWAYSITICVIIFICLLSFTTTSCQIEPIGPLIISTNTNTNETNGGGSVPSDIQKVYCERTEGVQIALNSTWEVWDNSVVFTERNDGTDGGTNSIECVKSVTNWLGFTIKTSGGSQNISGYNFLVVSLKITNDFSQDLQIGLGLTNDQAWYNITESRDNAWHVFVLDVSSNTNLDILDWAFAMRTVGGSWSNGTVRFDDVYYTKTTNHLSNVIYSVGTLVTNPAGNPALSNILKVYSDRSDGTNIPATNWQIWEGSVVFTDIIGDGSDGGINAVECGKGSKDWMGFAIKTDSGHEDISGYNFLIFSLKITNDFSQDLQVGLGLTNAQSWYNIAETRDNAWHTFVLDVSSNTNLDIMDWAFAMRTSGGTWSSGTVRFDDVYFAKTTNHLSNYSMGELVTNISGGEFGIFSDSIPLGIEWDINAKLDVWTVYGGGMTITKISNGTYEGSEAWSIVGSGSWMGMGIRVEPISTLKDMSAYSNGSLVFYAKGSKSAFKFGIKSNSPVSAEAWIFYNQITNYGYVPDNSWHKVQVPISVFKTKNANLNLGTIEQYFMLASDSGMGYTVGDTYYLDNMYWSMTTN